ncbi:nodulation receptor kinase-like [Iris pallida]|uniref:non-specific serine/threonine protein kinase n=1 Tax=Iris pallida TaxID=29817 RepID=A0AAX6IJ25_IRIPA|nr:nodulation receptor kinase-like [Iris pallida]
MRENMVACLPLLFFLFIFISSPAAAVAPPGFISIACCAKSNTTDPQTTIAYISDDYLLDNVGICKNVAYSTITSYFDKTARVFGNDNHTRWCYNLPVTKEQEYLVRTTFLGGPFFRSMNDTSFNASFGSTSISQIDSSRNWIVVEGVFTATENHANICLVRGIGNAYISKLELRPINDGTYLHGSKSSILKLISRVDLGNEDFAYRYPIDLADRIWETGTYITGSTSLSSSKITPQGANISIPIEVLQTAVVNAERLQFLHADLDVHHYDYVIILYFLELDASVQTGERIFDVYINGDEMYHNIDILQTGRASNYREISVRVKLNGYLNISLVKASDEIKYGPICNAYEVFQVYQKAAETLERDATAMLNIRDELMLKNPRNEILEKWHEDPCLPCPWERLSCEEMNGTLVVTMLDLSSMNLQGPLPTAISDLKEIKELDLQRNNFSGSIPDSFTSLQNLSKLYIGCNPSLNSQLPPGLSGLQNITINSESCASLLSASIASQRNVYIVGTVAGGSIACSIILGVFFTCFYRRARPNKKEFPAIKNAVFSESSIHDPHDSYLNPVVQSFSLQYIKRATCHYSTMIGEGGFGAVYRGTLPQGQEVAVKVRSSTSTQGTREFDNEVTLLSAIRHENLVPLLGYCCEYDHQILVYPFMSNGSLQDRLYGEASKRKVLDWPTRLSIALGAARGKFNVSALFCWTLYHTQGCKVEQHSSR